MSMRSIFAQLILAVLLTVLFAWPQAAQAHQGHMHANAAHHADAGKTQHKISAPVEQVLSAATLGARTQAHDIACANPGCCAHGPCTACCSMVAPALPLMAPPMLRAVVGDNANSSRSGIDGPSLRRPPRSFA